MLVPPPTCHEKVPAARFARAQNRPCTHTHSLTIFKMFCYKSTSISLKTTHWDCTNTHTHKRYFSLTHIGTVLKQTHTHTLTIFLSHTLGPYRNKHTQTHTHTHTHTHYHYLSLSHIGTVQKHTHTHTHTHTLTIFVSLCVCVCVSYTHCHPLSLLHTDRNHVCVCVCVSYLWLEEAVL